MALERWITNLESEQSMADAVKAAEQDVKAKDTPQTRAALASARFKQADVAKTMRQIEMETQGRFSLGEPMATEFRTKDEIAADGIIGIYRQGAGDGA